MKKWFVIEFSDYFNKSYTPEEEFGRRFFDDWNDSDWNRFYVFMIKCLQYYLMNGLVEYERVNLEKKKLMAATSEEFMEFIEDVELNKWHGKKILYKKYLEDYPEYTIKSLTQRTFTYWLKVFAKVKGYKFEEKKSGDERTFMLMTPDYIENEEKKEGTLF